MKFNINLGNLWEMLSGIGTFGAVIISLWLSRRIERPSLYIHYCFDYEESTHIFEILNIGQVPATIVHEGLSMYKRRYFRKQVDFDGVLVWTYNEKYTPAQYANTLRPGESVYLKIEDSVMRKTIYDLIGQRKKEKVYFYIVDNINRVHFYQILVKYVLEEI